jgi:hypothetical protein
MQQVINGLYTGANAALIRAEDKPNITVDTRTNSLVVSSSEKTFATVEALLLKLDAQLPIDLRDIRLVALKNADAGVMAATLQITAKVTAIDLKRHKTTLQFPDGTTRTVAVRKDVDLTQRKVGEEVVIRCTEAIAIAVEKP